MCTTKRHGIPTKGTTASAKPALCVMCFHVVSRVGVRLWKRQVKMGARLLVITTELQRV